LARRAFGTGEDGYAAILCRPVLATCPRITRRTTYAEVAAHFADELEECALSYWDYVPYAAGPPAVWPHMASVATPAWTNATAGTLGPFGGIAVFGSLGASHELMWVTPLSPAVNVPAGDVLRVPDKVRFTLEAA